jgi:HNH endonuclease
MSEKKATVHAPNFQDLAGQTFGRLTAVKFVGVNPRRKALWLCRCLCGREIVRRSDQLKDGRSNNCGCSTRKGPVPRPVADKFRESVNKESGFISPHVGTECWEWTGSLRTNGMGYGYVCHRNRHLEAHRVSYELTHGSLEEAACVLHRCDNPRCVRPDHLFLGSRKDNAEDRESKGRGENNRLTAGLALEIYRRYQEGFRPGWKLGAEHGVSGATVRSIVEGRTWSHITGATSRERRQQ